MNFSVIDPLGRWLGAWATDFGWPSVILRMALSFAMAAIIGYERSSKRHAAGLRTFIIVSLACTMTMMLDIYLGISGGQTFYLISAAAVAGVAVITCNSILFSSRSQIRGLTTAVGLWAVAVLGLVTGAGFYTMTLIFFVVFLCSLSLLPHFESFLKNRSNHFEVHLELKNIAYLQDFVTTIRELGMKIDDIESNTAYHNSGLSVYSISISISSEELRKYKTHTQIIEALATLDYVYHIEEMN